MMDVSDGLLLDAKRMAEASRCTLRIDLDTLPLSAVFIEAQGQDLEARLFAATGGDDYALLAALPPRSTRQHFLYQKGRRSSRIGTLAAGRPTVRLAQRGQAGRTCRRGWVLSIRTISIAGHPLRQWLIGISGLASGMMLALLIR